MPTEFGAGILSRLADCDGISDVWEVLGFPAVYRDSPEFRSCLGVGGPSPDLAPPTHGDDLRGRYNTWFGYRCFASARFASYCSAYGFEALERNRDGVWNSGFGEAVLIYNEDGSYNTGGGVKSLHGRPGKSLGDRNTAWGVGSGLQLAYGDDNSLFGYYAGGGPDFTGSKDTLVGGYAGCDLTSGVLNTFIGYRSGCGVTIGNYNVIINSPVGVLPYDLSNALMVFDGQGRSLLEVHPDGRVLFNGRLVMVEYV